MAPAMVMSKKSIDVCTEKHRERYSRMTGRRVRRKLLDEYVEATGYERNMLPRFSEESAGSPRGEMRDCDADAWVRDRRLLL
jgi:hypothetical protein